MCRVLEPNIPQVKLIHWFVQITDSLLRVCSSCWDERQEKSVHPGLPRAYHLFKGKNKQVRSPQYDTTLMAESKQELKSLWMKGMRKVKKMAYNSTFRNQDHGKQMGKQWKQRKT